MTPMIGITVSGSERNAIGCGSSGRKLVSVEMGLLPLARNKFPKLRNGARWNGYLFRLRARLARMAFLSNFRDALG